jgi:hypothetical protein
MTPEERGFPACRFNCCSVAKLSMARARRNACYQDMNPQERCDRLPGLQRRARLNQIDAVNLNVWPDAEAAVGARRHDGFHTSAGEDILRLRRPNRQNHGTQGCVPTVSGPESG